MTEKLMTIIGTTLLLLMVVEPAVAGAVGIPRVPEPATMTLFGLGAAGAFIARKFVGRK
jgi:hypothetical protein